MNLFQKNLFFLILITPLLTACNDRSSKSADVVDQPVNTQATFNNAIFNNSTWE